MKEELTYKLINKLKPKDKDYEVRDTKLPGLVLRVRKSGMMTYALLYMRGKRLTIGPADKIDHEQAREIARGLLADCYKGKDLVEEKRLKKLKVAQAQTYLQFLDERYKPWLIQSKQRRPDETYATLKNGFVELHELKLDEITPAILEDWLVRRRQEKVSETKTVTESRIRRQLNDLKACFNRAINKWDLLKTNPVERLELKKIDRLPKVRYLSTDEESSLRKALDDREEEIKAGRDSGNQWREKRNYKPISDLRKQTFADHVKPTILLSLNTGLRRGELLKLKWADVHLEQKNLTVDAETAKTGTTRHIPLNDEALAILKEWKKQPGIKSQYVFSDSTGQPFHDMRTSWEGVLNKAKITNFRWHDMRHSFASRLVMAGVDLNTVRELLGHSNYTMTLRYAHLAPKVKQDAVDKLVSVKYVR